MAAAIHGSTLHFACDLPRPGEDRERKLTHGDVENLFIQNEKVRWILVDEVSMISDTLLGDFEHQISSAARATRYRTRRDKTRRIFGGYNMLLFGDWWQLPPIPESAALFKPPLEKSQNELAKC